MLLLLSWKCEEKKLSLRVVSIDRCAERETNKLSVVPMRNKSTDVLIHADGENEICVSRAFEYVLTHLSDSKRRQNEMRSIAKIKCL